MTELRKELFNDQNMPHDKLNLFEWKQKREIEEKKIR
jgi:hypothetical protein